MPETIEGGIFTLAFVIALWAICSVMAWWDKRHGNYPRY